MSPLNVDETLKEARALIESPERWIKGSLYSKNDQGEQCYCALGALSTAMPNGAGYIAGLQRLLAALPPDRPYHVPTFNDAEDTTHEDILALFDRAIADEKWTKK